MILLTIASNHRKRARVKVGHRVAWEPGTPAERRDYNNKLDELINALKRW